MTSSSKAREDLEMPDFESLSKEFAAMKRDIAALAANLKSGNGHGVADSVHEAASDLSDRAAQLYENLATQGKRSVKAVSHQVEEQPLLSLLVAFGVGFVASKLLSR
jgi:ElaB/YqjD/DUF883 family membrane-anchored ribosome-binding protein